MMANEMKETHVSSITVITFFGSRFKLHNTNIFFELQYKFKVSSVGKYPIVPGEDEQGSKWFKALSKCVRDPMTAVPAYVISKTFFRTFYEGKFSKLHTHFFNGEIPHCSRCLTVGFRRTLERIEDHWPTESRGLGSSRAEL
jgi:hypothetical protein